MPIKPENKKRYRSNWPAIRQAIRVFLNDNEYLLMQTICGLVAIGSFLSLAFLLPTLVVS